MHAVSQRCRKLGSKHQGCRCGSWRTSSRSSRRLTHERKHRWDAFVAIRGRPAASEHMRRRGDSHRIVGAEARQARNPITGLLSAPGSFVCMALFGAPFFCHAPSPEVTAHSTRLFRGPPASATGCTCGDSNWGAVGCGEGHAVSAGSVRVKDACCQF